MSYFSLTIIFFKYLQSLGYVSKEEFIAALNDESLRNVRTVHMEMKESPLCCFRTFSNLTHPLSFSLLLYLCVSFPLSLSLSLCFYPSLSLFLSLSITLSVSLSVWFYISVSTVLFFSITHAHTFSLSFYSSFSLSHAQLTNILSSPSFHSSFSL